MTHNVLCRIAQSARGARPDFPNWWLQNSPWSVVFRPVGCEIFKPMHFQKAQLHYFSQNIGFTYSCWNIFSNYFYLFTEIIAYNSLVYLQIYIMTIRNCLWTWLINKIHIYSHNITLYFLKWCIWEIKPQLMFVLLYMVNFTSTLVAGGLHHQRPTYTKVFPPCWQKVRGDPWATWNQRGWPPSLNMARLHVNLTPPAHLQFLPHTHTHTHQGKRKVPNATDLSLKCDMKYDDFTMDSCVSLGNFTGLCRRDLRDANWVVASKFRHYSAVLRSRTDHRLARWIPCTKEDGSDWSQMRGERSEAGGLNQNTFPRDIAFTLWVRATILFQINYSN